MKILYLIILFFITIPSAYALPKMSSLGASLNRSDHGDIVQSNNSFGLQLNVAISKSFSAQLSYSKFRDNYQTRQIGISQKQKLTSLGLSLFYHMPVHSSLSAYALAGVNYNLIDTKADLRFPDAFAIETKIKNDNAYGYHFGVGLNYPLSKKWHIFSEYRYTFVEIKGKIQISAPILALYEEDKFKEDYNHGLLKVGVSYQF